MRKEFFDTVFAKMKDDKDIYMIFAGLGYPRYDEFKKEYLDRVINSEASEQTALDIAVGLALSNKKPFVYTITPFYWRAAETIRTYISHERIGVRMIGAGRDQDYLEDGFSHNGEDIGKLMGILDVACRYPQDVDEMRQNVDKMIELDEPSYLSLRR